MQTTAFHYSHCLYTQGVLQSCGGLETAISGKRVERERECKELASEHGERKRDIEAKLISVVDALWGGEREREKARRRHATLRDTSLD